MKRPLSLHTKSTTTLINKTNSNHHQHPTYNNNKIFYHHHIIQQNNPHSFSQPKTTFPTPHSSQSKPQAAFVNSNPNSTLLTPTTNNKSQTLKRVSILKNKIDTDKIKGKLEYEKQLSEKVLATQSMLNKHHQLKPKDNTQLNDSSNMFLTNVNANADQKYQPPPNSTQQVSMKRLFHQSAYQSVYTSGSITPKGNVTAEYKWEKVIQLYTMREQLSKKFQFPSMIKLRKKYPILPSGEFYRILNKPRVFDKEWRINFPQTISEDSEGNTVMIYTNSKGILCKKMLMREGEKKQSYREQVLKWRQQLVQQLLATNKMKLLKSIRIEENPNAPLSIMKYTEDNGYEFETDVQSYRNFIERKIKPTRDSIMQRYIYSNNLKAMVFRLYYHRQLNSNPGGCNKPEYSGIRFQNEKHIFRQSTSNSFCDVHKLTSIITLSNQRINSIKVIPITNPKALLKYTPIAKQLQKLLEYTEKLLIDKLYIDFIVDIFDKPWVINIKYCEVNPNTMLKSPILQDHTNNVGPCRLCGVVVNRQQLKNSVSVRMLCEFIHHLKKRTKHQDMFQIQFIQNLNINSMENKSSSVCKICYKVIIHQLQLIKMEKKLAQICNIIPSNSQDYLQPEYKTYKNPTNIGQFKQWRLMLFFQDIKNVQVNFHQKPTSFFNSGSAYHGNDYFSRNDNSKSQTQYFLKYQLCPKISQSFLCKKQNTMGTNLKINKVKLHYFYSQTTNIEQFINNTEIILSLYSAQTRPQNNNHIDSNNQYDLFEKFNEKCEKTYHNQKFLASGSTHILSNFNFHKSSQFSMKTLMENGQKQTATVLLFFQNKKYCELTLKVGLVYDGSYNVNNIPTKRENSTNQISQSIKWKQVWFSRNIWNSNPLPKQWMQIFGSKYNYDNNLNSIEQTEMVGCQNEEEILKKILDDSDVDVPYDD